MPVAILLQGYTNALAGSEAAQYVGDEPEALFMLTNRTGSGLRCKFTVDAFRPERAVAESTSSGEVLIPSGAVRILSVVTPVTTNGWRFHAVISVSGRPPLWKTRIGNLLGRVGLHFRSLDSDTVYPTLTNSWTAL